MLGRPFPAVETMLHGAKEELLAFTGVPVTHRKEVWSTNPLERLTKETSRAPTSLVLLNPAALLRLAGAVLVEAHDECPDRRSLSDGPMALLTSTAKSPEEVAEPALIAS